MGIETEVHLKDHLENESTTEIVSVETNRWIKKILKYVHENILLILTIACVVLGGVIGTISRRFAPSPETIYYVGFPGELLMRIFKLLLLPLVVSSIVSGIANLQGQSKGKMGLATFGYYISTTLVAIAIGITLAMTIRPGAATEHVRTTSVDTSRPLPTAIDTLLDLIRNLFPENILQAGIQHSKTSFKKLPPDSISPGCSFVNPSEDEVTEAFIENLDCNNTEVISRWEKVHSYHNGLNVTGLLVFFAIFGVMLNKMGEKGRLMIEFFNILNEVTQRMTKIVMWYCPLGIMFIIIHKILSVPNLAQAVRQLGMYLVTGLTGLAIHSGLVIPLVYFVLTRKNAYRVYLNMLQAGFVGLGTSSSSAALPITLHCCENKSKFDKNICRFVLPIGATINMDGLAIVQAATPLFLAQMNNRGLMFGDIIAISLSATLASIGAAGVPGTGFLTMLSVVVAAGLPVEDAYIVLSVDWFIMRCVTVTNIFGDAIAAGIFTHFFGRDNKKSDELLGSVNSP